MTDVLAEIGILQSACSLVAGICVYLLTSASGWQLDVVLALWSWGMLTGVALLWSWRRGVRARGERLALIETARARGVLDA